MFAIVTIAGHQYKVVPNQYLYVNRLGHDVGESVSFSDVLLVANGSDVSVGQPTVSGASVKGKILEHLKGDKVIVFKKKRRKGYAVKRGHRQHLTKVQIESINA
jgi:large subunit ribosomal protein L21